MIWIILIFIVLGIMGVVGYVMYDKSNSSNDIDEFIPLSALEVCGDLGGSEPHTTVKNENECATRCLSTTTCTAFNYYPDTNECAIANTDTQCGVDNRYWVANTDWDGGKPSNVLKTAFDNRQSYIKKGAYGNLAKDAIGVINSDDAECTIPTTWRPGYFIMNDDSTCNIPALNGETAGVDMSMITDETEIQTIAKQNQWQSADTGNLWAVEPADKSPGFVRVGESLGYAGVGNALDAYMSDSNIVSHVAWIIHPTDTSKNHLYIRLDDGEVGDTPVQKLTDAIEWLGDGNLSKNLVVFEKNKA